MERGRRQLQERTATEADTVSQEGSSTMQGLTNWPAHDNSDEKERIPARILKPENIMKDKSNRLELGAQVPIDSAQLEGQFTKLAFFLDRKKITDDKRSNKSQKEPTISTDEEYPPGFFDKKEEQWFPGSFYNYFMGQHSFGMKPLKGDGDFLEFWKKFNTLVHRRPDNQVHPQTKLAILEKLLEPNNKAHKCVQPLLKHLNRKESYNWTIKVLWRQFKDNLEETRKKTIQEMLQLIPSTQSSEDQVRYMDMMKYYYYSIINQMVQEKEAGKMVIEQITKTVNQTLVCEIFKQNGMHLEEKWTWFLEGNIEDNLWRFCASIHAISLGVDITSENSPFRIQKTKQMDPGDNGHSKTQQQERASTRSNQQKDTQDIFRNPMEVMENKILTTRCCQTPTHLIDYQNLTSTPVKPVLDNHQTTPKDP